MYTYIQEKQTEQNLCGIHIVDESPLAILFFPIILVTHLRRSQSFQHQFLIKMIDKGWKQFPIYQIKFILTGTVYINVEKESIRFAQTY